MRLTEKSDKGYTSNDTASAVEKLGKLEDMLQDLTREYEKTVDLIEDMKTKGKSKTVTYHQLIATKMTLQNIITRFDIYLR